MTDKGYDNPPPAGANGACENGSAGGHDADATWLLLDSGRVPRGEAGGEAFRDWSPGETAEDDGEEDDAQACDPSGLNGDATGAVAEMPGVDGVDDPQPHDAGGQEDGEAVQAPEFTEEDQLRHLRMGEALLFASAEPLRTEQIAERLPDGADVQRILADLADHYRGRGVNLVRVAGGWTFRTAPDLSFLMERERVEQRKLSRAALETLAIIAYHQPVTRAEIEDIRGVSVSKGTIDVLMEIGWVRVRGRRQTPGRPVTYGTTDAFLEHFGLDRVSDLPGMDELKAAGLLDTRMPTNISIPRPSDEAEEDDDDFDGEREDETEFHSDGEEETGEDDSAPDEGREEEALDAGPDSDGEKPDANGVAEPAAGDSGFAGEDANGADYADLDGEEGGAALEDDWPGDVEPDDEADVAPGHAST